MALPYLNAPSNIDAEINRLTGMETKQSLFVYNSKAVASYIPRITSSIKEKQTDS